MFRARAYAASGGEAPIQTRKGSEAYEREFIEAALSTSTRSREERRLDEFAVDFLKAYRAAKNKYATLEAKESILRVHLIPELRSLPLGDVNAGAIQTYRAKQLSEGLSPKTVNNHLTVLRKMLSVALEWEIIDVIPPVKWLKVPPQKFDFLSFEEAPRKPAPETAGRVLRSPLQIHCATTLRPEARFLAARFRAPLSRSVLPDTTAFA